MLVSQLHQANKFHKLVKLKPTGLWRRIWAATTTKFELV